MTCRNVYQSPRALHQRVEIRADVHANSGELLRASEFRGSSNSISPLTPILSIHTGQNFSPSENPLPQTEQTRVFATFMDPTVLRTQAVLRKASGSPRQFPLDLIPCERPLHVKG